MTDIDDDELDAEAAEKDAQLRRENPTEYARQVVGGPSALARAIGGISPQAVGQWQRVPAERVIEVERVTGVSRHELRPDIYPD